MLVNRYYEKSLFLSRYFKKTFFERLKNSCKPSEDVI